MAASYPAKPTGTPRTRRQRGTGPGPWRSGSIGRRPCLSKVCGGPYRRSRQTLPAFQPAIIEFGHRADVSDRQRAVRRCSLRGGGLRGAANDQGECRMGGPRRNAGHDGIVRDHGRRWPRPVYLTVTGISLRAQPSTQAKFRISGGTPGKLSGCIRVRVDEKSLIFFDENGQDIRFDHTIGGFND